MLVTYRLPLAAFFCERAKVWVLQPSSIDSSGILYDLVRRVRPDTQPSPVLNARRSSWQERELHQMVLGSNSGAEWCVSCDSVCPRFYRCLGHFWRGFEMQGFPLSYGASKSNTKDFQSIPHMVSSGDRHYGWGGGTSDLMGPPTELPWLAFTPLHLNLWGSSAVNHLV